MVGGVRQDLDRRRLVRHDAFDAFGMGGEQVQGDDRARADAEHAGGLVGRQQFQYPERVVGVLGHPLLGLGVVQRASGHAARIVGRDRVVGGQVVGDAVEGGRAARPPGISSSSGPWPRTS